MAIANENLPHDAGFIVSLANGKRSLENVTILAGSGSDRVLTAGTVLGMVTASSKYIAFDEDAVDGSEDAAAILLNDTTAPDGEDVVAAVVIRDAEINASELEWGTADAGEQTAALVQLNALGIRERTAI